MMSCFVILICTIKEQKVKAPIRPANPLIKDSTEILLAAKSLKLLLYLLFIRMGKCRRRGLFNISEQKKGFLYKTGSRSMTSL